MRRNILIATVLLAIAAGIFYWWWRTPRTLRESDFVVVGDIVNQSHEPDFEGSLREAVRVGLGQSPRLNLVSDEKIRSTLRSLGKPDGATITQEIATILCERTGAKAYVTGVLKQTGQSYALEMDAYTCPGARLASGTESAARTDLVVQHLGTLIAELRRKLGEGSDSLKKYDVPLERATTPIPTALKAYAQARSAIRDVGDIAAIPLYKKAIDLDSRFALAHSGLAVSYYNLNQMAQASVEIRQAYEAGDRQSLRQRLNITTLYYDLGVGDVEKAIQSYKVYISEYPKDDVALGNLSSEYFVLGNYEEAARCAREALRIDPDSAAWYENLSTAELALARTDEAEATLKEAFSRKLDDAALHANRYSLAFLKNDTALMQQELAWGESKKGGDDSILAAQADTEAYYGRLAKAREFTRKAVEAARNAELPESEATWIIEGAMREAMFGNMEEAHKSAEEALKLAPDSKDIGAMAALVFARTGDEANAVKLTDDLRALYVSNMVMQRAWLPVVRAQLAMHKKQNVEAIQQLAIVAPYEKGQLTGNLSDSCMIPVYLRAEAELNSQKGEAALVEFKKIQASPGIIGSCWSGPLAKLGEARAQATNGSSAAAKESYSKFFALWKDADASIPILKQAKLEAAKLH